MDIQRVEALLNERKAEIPLLVKFLSEFLVSNDVILDTDLGLCGNYNHYYRSVTDTSSTSRLLVELVEAVYCDAYPIEYSSKAYAENHQKYAGYSLRRCCNLAINILDVISNHTLKYQE